jgi:hypothetical protein
MKKALFWFNFKHFSPLSLGFFALEPVTRQNIMAGSMSENKVAHFLVARKQRDGKGPGSQYPLQGHTLIT